MSGGRNGDVEVADGAGMVRSDGMGHVSKSTRRSLDVCNSQSRMWLLPCVRRLTDILG